VRRVTLGKASSARTAAIASLAAALLLAAPRVASAKEGFKHWWLPEDYSVHGHAIDSLFLTSALFPPHSPARAFWALPHSMLTIRDLKKSHGGRTLFEDAAMQVNYGERVALVGANGTGKSTLFSIILKTEDPDAGALADRLEHIGALQHMFLGGPGARHHHSAGRRDAEGAEHGFRDIFLHRHRGGEHA